MGLEDEEDKGGEGDGADERKTLRRGGGEEGVKGGVHFGVGGEEEKGLAGEVGVGGWEWGKSGGLLEGLGEVGCPVGGRRGGAEAVGGDGGEDAEGGGAVGLGDEGGERFHIRFPF